MAEQPTVEALIRANARFYETFEALDFAAMSGMWEKSERVYCCHPGWTPLRGERPVLDSWKRIIQNTTAISFTLSHVTAHVDGQIGVVTLFETISSRVGHERHSSSTAVTNLFSFDAASGQWRIFHHHASHAAAPEEDDAGLLN